MTQRSSIIITASLISLSTLGINAKPLLAHGGHSSQNDSQDKQQTIDNQPLSPKEVQHEAMPQMSSDEENSSKSQDTVEEQPAPTKSEIVPATSLETGTVEPVSAPFIPILGESLLVLLLAGPFLLVAFKRWFHK